ncbi:MAG: choice-of-anchor D domain-containing protein [Bacteroidota bacterium]
MRLLLRLTPALFCAIALAFLPRAAAQVSVSPSSIERTLAAGDTTSTTLTVSNTGTEETPYAVFITDVPLLDAPEATASSRVASSLRLAPPMWSDVRAKAAPAPIAFSPQSSAMRMAATDDPAFVFDSLAYDNGDPYPDTFLGTGEPGTQLFVAQRFTPTGPFSLDGIRAYLNANNLGATDFEPTDLTVLVEVYTAPDANEPRGGRLLVGTETGLNAGFQDFAEIPLNTVLQFNEGEDFFVVLTLIGPDFPMGVDLSGTEDAPGRAFSSRTGETGTWTVSEDLTGELATPFLIRALNGTSTGSGFLSVGPASGLLAPGASATLGVSIDARRLIAGTYSKFINVVEGATGEITTVPVTLTVTGEGAVTLSTSSVDLGEVAIGTARGQTLTVINEGTAPFTITGSSSTDPALEAFGLEVGATLLPGSETPFAVRFAPTAPGPFSGTLTITTDVGEASVDVTAVGFEPPVAVVTPSELATSLAPGATTSLPLTIENTGGSSLAFSATVRGAGGSASDSLFYDDGDEFADTFIGSGDAATPLFAAQRFTAEGAFDLWGLRLFVNTFTLQFHNPDSTETGDAIDLDIFAEVYAADDPFVPNAGDVLATARAVVPAGTQGFVAMAMDRSLTFDAGTSFFVVLRFEGNAFPLGIDDTGTGDSDGRAFLAIDPAEWFPNEDYLGNGTIDTFPIRALSAPPGQRLVTIDQPRGDIAPGSDVALAVTVDATDTELGQYDRSIVIRTNDPTQPEIVVPVTIVVEGAGVMPLTPGWNLVSWNIELDDMRLQAALASVWEQVEQVQLYREGGWMTYEVAASNDTEMRLRTGEAIWVKLREAADLTMDGAAMAMEAMPLEAGLNAVAYLPSAVDVTAHAFASIMDATESIQSFHSTGVAYAPGVPDAFQTLGLVRPGMGYLVQATAPVQLDYPLVAAPAEFAGVPLSSLVAAEREAGVTPTPAWISAWSQNLDLAAGTLVTAVDPDGVVAGAFTVQNDGALGLMAIYADDPTTDIDEGAEPGDRITLRTDAGIVTDDLIWSYAGAVVEVTNLVVSTEEPGGVPAAFALHGGYPNPFTNATTVTFDLPEASDVQLDVFDSTGRRVATLLSETVAAGSHTTTWDAARMASGLYLVVLRAGDFVATQRAVVLR